MVFVFSIYSLVKSFGAYPVDEGIEVIRKSSFVYASQYLNPDEIIIEETYAGGDYFEDPNMLLYNSAFVATASPIANSSFLSEKRSGIIAYTVQPGDTASQIADSFGLTTNTLLWANNLSIWDYIKPGQELVILPVSGIKHEVKKGETLDKIVKNYKGDLEKTIEFNGLPADGKLAIGQEIIIPDGKKPVYYYPQTPSYASYASFPALYSDKSHQFPVCQCTWYIAQRRYIPWNGHAKTWIYKAAQYGFATGATPKPGAIMQTNDNWYYGHVAYVESVDYPYVTVSEMHLGQCIRKVRTLSVNDWRIVGYIY